MVEEDKFSDQQGSLSKVLALYTTVNLKLSLMW